MTHKTQQRFSRNFVFYDIETTGLNKAFDQILQFAAILTDSNLKEIERFEVRCRLLPWVIPSPTALLITGVSIQLLEDEALPSFYEMMAMVSRKLHSWSPAIFTGYNSMRFDEPILQRALWSTLYPAFLTVTNGSTRMDILTILQATASLHGTSIKIPISSVGKNVFKLDQVAPLNGFSHDKAHDALNDVEATIHVASKIKATAPNLWENMLEKSNKTQVFEVLKSRQPCLFLEYFASKENFWWGVRIDPESDKGSRSTVLRLDYDWEELSKLNNLSISKALLKSPKPL